MARRRRSKTSGDFNKPPFAELYFGMSDSKNEALKNRDDFIKSYVNLRDSLGAVVSGDKFLVLGPKGTGKSALAWFLKATEDRGQYVVSINDAVTLPLAEVPQLKTGQPPGSERTVTAWKFILLCNYLELLLKDPGSPLHMDSDVDRVASALRDYGFIGDGSGRALLSASKVTWRVPIPKGGSLYEREKTQSLSIFNVIPHLERWVSYVGASVPIMALDGLDSIFLNDSKYNESLASLIQATYGLNQSLRYKGSNGTVVLLLRNDIFSRISLHLPDSQKMRDDHAVQLDWRVLSGGSGLTSPLMQLVNSKAARALEVPFIDTLSYFPKDIQQGAPGRAPTWTPTLKYLLNLTRHTPRDLLRLFESIRQVESEQDNNSRKTLRDAVIREGVVRYGSEYFVGAIKNEFAGFDDGVIQVGQALSAFQHLDKTAFTRDEFVKALRVDSDNVTLDDASTMLRRMFMAGAIGNLVSRPGGSYLQFYHRKDDSEIHLSGRFILANALAHAWNIPFTHGD